MQEGKSNLELEKNLEDTIGVSFRAFRTIRVYLCNLILFLELTRKAIQQSIRQP
jgi:hypothetical protein